MHRLDTFFQVVKLGFPRFVAVLTFVLSGLPNLPCLAAESIPLTDFETSLRGFAEPIVDRLPMIAGTGLHWADAYTGQLLRVPPNVGVGLAVGGVRLPRDAVDRLVDTGPFTALADQNWYGAYERFAAWPPPLYVIEARFGGVFLPFDVGVKFGRASGWQFGEVGSGDDAGATDPADPADTSDPTEPADPAQAAPTVDYLLTGGDIRFALMQGGFLLPAVSIGLGVNYTAGAFHAGQVLPDMVVTSIPYAGDSILETYDVTIEAPEFVCTWEAATLDMRVQVSKRLLVVTPYVGMGMTYGRAAVSAGFAGAVEPTDPDVTVPGGASGLDGASGSGGEGFFVSVERSEMIDTRVFGGMSFNVFMVRLDINAMYDVDSQAMGATAAVRVQL